MTLTVDPPIVSPRGRLQRPAERPVRTALVGAGFIADYHLQILKKDPAVKVVGICDPDQGRLRRVADQWNIEVRTSELADLLSRAKPDVVHVLVPPAFHYAVAKQIIESGCHALIEKPLTLSASDARLLALLADEKKVLLGVNHNWMHQPLFERALVHIAARKIGPVRHVVSVNSLPLFQLAAGMHDHWMFEHPANVLFEQAPHPLSQICALIGDVCDLDVMRGQPRRLCGGNLFYSDWQFSIRGRNATAQVWLSFERSFLNAELHIVGQDGTIHIDQLNNLYALDRRTRFSAPLDCLLRGARQTTRIASGAGSQFLTYGLSLFRIIGRRDVYYLGMKNSINAFYRDLLAAKLRTASLDNALQTMEALQRAADKADLLPDEPQFAERKIGPVRSKTTSKTAAKVLVIGAGGFIGRKTVTRLAMEGHPVRAMVRCPKRIADLAERCNIEVVQGDVEVAADVNRAVNGCETVIHLAAGAPPTWDGYRRLFVDGLGHVADAVLRHQVNRLFFASSIASLYLGDPSAVITEESSLDSRPDKRCYYARAKILCEQLLDDIHAKQGLPCVVFRPGLVVGEGSSPQHLGLGEWPSETLCIRWGRNVSRELPFVLVDDVADALICALKADISDVAGKKFNLVGDVRLSAREYLHILRNESQRDFRLRRLSVPAWAAVESAKWLLKLLARRPENSRLTWHELVYRTAASQFNCERTKQMLQWRPTADRDVFIERGIRAAMRSETAL